MFVIDNDDSFKEFNDMVASGEATIVNAIGDVLEVIIDKKLIQIEVAAKYKTIVEKTDNLDTFLYGKDDTQAIVNVTVKDDNVHIFTKNGKIVKPFKQWVLSPSDYSGFSKLQGNQHYRYIKLFSQDEFESIRSKVYQKDLYTIWNSSENYMVRNGLTYFKGLKSSDLDVLSFDIETSGLNRFASDAEVFIITNTFRKNNEYIRKHFVLSDYPDQQDMIHDWCKWVREQDPDLLLGHNVVIFDIPYLDHQYRKKYGTNLPLGREGYELEFEARSSEFRKDGSQSYSYNRISCFGREVVDTFFLAVKSDIQRKYESYGLKAIIRQEGLEKEGRSFIDASKIKQYYNDRNVNPEMWEKTLQYAIEDSDDSLKIFDLMVPSLFYFTQHIPKTFQQMLESATGSQINSFLVRAYLQDGWSIPKATKLTEKVEGGISFAVPGVYRNLLKVDLKSCYPSQVLRFKLYDKDKDPKQYFYKMVHHFTYARFDLKAMYKKTGDIMYYAREQTSKIFINSAYGVCNTPGLNFNSPSIAAKITAESRAIIDFALTWASGNGKDYWMKLFKDRIGKNEEE